MTAKQLHKTNPLQAAALAEKLKPTLQDDLVLNVTGLAWDGQRWDLPQEVLCAS